MKGDAVNVARMVLFTEKKCAILVILGLKSRVAKIDYYKWIL